MLTPGAVIVAIWNIVTTVESLNEKGAVVPRNEFHRSHYRAAKSLQKKLRPAWEIEVKNDDGSLEFVKPEDQGEKVATGRQKANDFEIELDDAEKRTLKAFCDEREQLPSLSDETLDSFEKLAGFKLVE